MERWNPEKQAYVSRPDIDSFIEEVLELCEKRGFIISSGEYINYLEIKDYDPSDCDLRNAMDCTRLEKS